MASPVKYLIFCLSNLEPRTTIEDHQTRTMAETMTDSISGKDDKVVATSAVDTESKVDGHVSLGQADAALEYLHAGEVATFSDIDEKRLVRKIDWMVVPLMWAIYFLQYLDKILSQCVATACFIRPRS